MLDRIRATPLPELFVVLLAAVVRFWRLSFHSIWFDEAVSLQWARSDASWIWSQTFPLVQEKHPPGYYLFLHLWERALALFGQQQNDAWLRASGALLGVLTVVGLLLLVGKLSGRGVAWLAGLLAALSPALVWYSQELRMFQPAATLAVWTAYFLLLAWREGSVGVRLLLWCGMVATLVAGAYIYLFSAFIFPATGLALLALFLVEVDRAGRRRWGRFGEGVGALVIATALFLPLARNAWLVNDAESTPAAPFAGFADALWRQIRVFTIWRPEWNPTLETALIALAALLILLGLLLPGRSRGTVERLWIWIWLLIPLLIGGAMLATTDSVFGEDRYFLFVAPFACWALAHGVLLLTQSTQPIVRGAGWATGVALVAALLFALPPLWTPGHARENWRAAVATIISEHEALPDLRTTVISHIDYTHLPAEWYLRQRYTFDELPLFFPFGGALTPEMMDDVIAPPLAGVEGAGYETLWLLQSHLDGMDDGRLVEGWLAERYPLIAEQFPAGIRQTGYAIRSRFDTLPHSLSDSQRTNAEVAPNLRLAACEVTTPQVSATDAFLHPPSGRAHVRLWWQADAPLLEDYSAQVRMVNEEGVWGEAIDRPGDAMRMMPTSTWMPGEFVRHEVEVNLNPAASPGAYQIVVAVVDEDGEAVRAPVVCGEVEVWARSAQP